jgi:hypothetical protein
MKPSRSSPVLADVLDGHEVRDAVSAAWSLLGNRLGAQAGVADPSPEYPRARPRYRGDLRPPGQACQPSAGEKPEECSRSVVLKAAGNLMLSR